MMPSSKVGAVKAEDTVIMEETYDALEQGGGG